MASLRTQVHFILLVCPLQPGLTFQWLLLLVSRWQQQLQQAHPTMNGFQTSKMDLFILCLLLRQINLYQKPCGTFPITSHWLLLHHIPGSYITLQYSWIFIGRTDAEAEAPIPWPPDTKNWLIRKDSRKGKIEGRRRSGWQRMRQLNDIS